MHTVPLVLQRVSRACGVLVVCIVSVELAEMERRCESELSAIQQHIAPLRRALGLSFVPKPSQHSTALNYCTAPSHWSNLSLSQLLRCVRACVCVCDICLIADELQLVFTSISRSQPSRPYLLSVYIDQHNDYAVQQCEPAIQGLTELLADVNRTVITAAGKEEMGDFGLFVMRVRQAFQLLAQAEDERTAANGSTVAH